MFSLQVPETITVLVTAGFNFLIAALILGRAYSLSWLQSTLRMIPLPPVAVCPNKGDTVNAEMSPMIAILMFIRFSSANLSGILEKQLI